MDMEQIIGTVRTFDGALVVTPGPTSGAPELAWGDAFFYHAPDGVMPEREQPYGTIVTKDYPGDDACDLDRDGRWRVNVHVDRATFRELVGADPRDARLPDDLTATDVLIPHPAYAAQGWVAVVNPGERTGALVLRLLRQSHDASRARHERRAATRKPSRPSRED
ncbi:DUF6194 family protein [Cellulosimicrobium cellulans]|uniref:DUF6194 family protein n=1 Tax=Cellulosimicrobium cellulans TaxID=1710 RepID=UPI000848679D|nr:DUF6194 family protein [Cellulosimicrobium cellulans]